MPGFGRAWFRFFFAFRAEKSPIFHSCLRKRQNIHSTQEVSFSIFLRWNHSLCISFFPPKAFSQQKQNLQKHNLVHFFSEHTVLPLLYRKRSRRLSDLSMVVSRWVCPGSPQVSPDVTALQTQLQETTSRLQQVWNAKCGYLEKMAVWNSKKNSNIFISMQLFCYATRYPHFTIQSFSAFYFVIVRIFLIKIEITFFIKRP